MSYEEAVTLALALVALAVFAGLGVAQQKAEEMKAVDKASPKVMTGKVIKDNQASKTFTVMAKGQMVTFNAAKLKALHKVGEIIDITYTENPGRPMMAATVK